MVPRGGIWFCSLQAKAPRSAIPTGIPARTRITEGRRLTGLPISCGATTLQLLDLKYATKVIRLTTTELPLKKGTGNCIGRSAAMVAQFNASTSPSTSIHVVHNWNGPFLASDHNKRNRPSASVAIPK